MICSLLLHVVDPWRCFNPRQDHRHAAAELEIAVTRGDAAIQMGTRVRYGGDMEEEEEEVVDDYEEGDDEYYLKQYDDNHEYGTGDSGQGFNSGEGAERRGHDHLEYKHRVVVVPRPVVIKCSTASAVATVTDAIEDAVESSRRRLHAASSSAVAVAERAPNSGSARNAVKEEEVQRAAEAWSRAAAVEIVLAQVRGGRPVSALDG